MKDIINRLLAFLGLAEREESIEQIVAPMAKVKAKLDAKAARHETAVKAHLAEIKRLNEEIAHHDNQASEAAVKAAKYAELAA